MDCIDCDKKFPDKNCIDCKGLIDCAYLAKKSVEDFQVELRSVDNSDVKYDVTVPSTRKNLIRGKLKEDLEKSKILDLIKVGTVLKYQDGKIRFLSANDKEMSLSTDYLKSFIESSLKERRYIREKVIDKDGKKVYDLHALPMNYNSGGLISIVVTDIILAERKNKERELKIYREVIEAVTARKLILISEDEIELVTGDGQIIVERDISTPSDLQKLRNSLKISLRKYGLSPKKEMHLLLCISEAASNALKHAGAGKVIVLLSKGLLQMIVKDNGQGIDFKKLPKATLMKSYSDSGIFSLGNGFTLMFRFIDRLYLKTDIKGTTIILNKEIS